MRDLMRQGAVIALIVLVAYALSFALGMAVAWAVVGYRLIASS